MMNINYKCFIMALKLYKTKKNLQLGTTILHVTAFNNNSIIL